MFVLTSSGLETRAANKWNSRIDSSRFQYFLIGTDLDSSPPLVEHRQIIARVMRLSVVADSLEADLVSSRIAATRVLEAMSI